MTILRLALRDLRGAMGGFWLLILCVALGTAAMAATGLLSRMVLDGVQAGARAGIGGDVSLRLYHRPPPPEHLALFAGAGTVSLTAELRLLAHGGGGGSSTLVEMKAVDAVYPLYGSVVLEPPMPLAGALAARDGIRGAVVAEELLEALGLALGDRILVGGQAFEMRALIRAEPDRALRGFTLGPRVIVALPAIEQSALVAPGTQTYWYSRLRLRDGLQADDWIRDFEQRFPEAGYRIVNAADGVPGVERSMGFVTSLLILLSLGMVLIGGVGVGGAVAAYLDRKRDTIAILKGLGATTATIRRLYLVQIMTASLTGIALGLALGIAATRAATPLLAGWLPLDPAIRLTPLASAAGFGLLASLIFALWPLARAAQLSPQELFRDLLAGERQRPGWRALAALGLLAVLLLLLLVWSAPLPVVAALFAAGAALAVLGFLLLGRVVAWTAGWAVRWVGGRTRRPLLRLALANLHRPGAPTAPLVLALGLCLTMLVAVTSVRDNAAAHLQDTLPATAPDLILLNLPPEEAARFDALMAAQPVLARWSRAPFLHGRLDRVGGVPVADLRIPAEIGFVVRGDRGLSWQADPPAGGLVAGEWWPADYQGPPLLSVDARVAEKLGATVGDILTLNVLGEPLEGRIANLRRVDWAGLDLDFPILLSPPADPPPHREIAALWLADEAALETVRAVLAGAFPESPTIEVAQVIGFLAGVAARGGTAMTALAAASGFAALLVLAGAVLAGQRRRAQEAVLLKMLGATRRQLAVATLLEYGLIALAAGLAALLLGNLAAWAAIGGWLDFRPALGSTLHWLVEAVAVMALAGLAALNRALARSPALMLRQG